MCLRSALRYCARWWRSNFYQHPPFLLFIYCCTCTSPTIMLSRSLHWLAHFCLILFLNNLYLCSSYCNIFHYWRNSSSYPISYDCLTFLICSCLTLLLLQSSWLAIFATPIFFILIVVLPTFCFISELRGGLTRQFFSPLRHLLILFTFTSSGLW